MDIKFDVFIATSLDGYIARTNGSMDWLEKAAPKGATEDYGYQRFFSDVDSIVLGRNTFEKASTFSQWPYGKKHVIVLSKMLKEPPADFADKIDVFSGKVELLAVDLQHRGVRKVYVDGGQTIQSFLRAGLIDNLTITQVPVLLGRGIPLFSDLAAEIELKLKDSKSFSSGFVQSTYQVRRNTRNRCD